MSNYNLNYCISKRTPASPKVLQEILDVQAILNRVCSWSHERLSLSCPKQAGRPGLGFHFVRFAHLSAAAPQPNRFGNGAEHESDDAFASGSTRVRDNLWNAHLVAAFLKYVSQMHPALLFELRDESGFVVPGSVWIQGGKVEPNREYLNKERARVLELTGDPQAAAPFVWAELQGLGGTFFQDAAAREYAHVAEIKALDANQEQLEAVGLEDVAKHVVDVAAKKATSVAV